MLARSANSGNPSCKTACPYVTPSSGALAATWPLGICCFSTPERGVQQWRAAASGRHRHIHVHGSSDDSNVWRIASQRGLGCSTTRSQCRF